MRDSLSDRLLRRELQDSSGRSRKIRSIYGDNNWIKNLDIVNELDGHSGCVNALSWSKSGRLLASGSDDQHINIHTYQPDDSTSQFSLATTVATGHRANIFSVKFMPHSNDRTLISAAGDHEVRIFDIEYSGTAAEASGASIMASQGSQRRRNNAYDRVRYLTDGGTNCRVYRSHGDRVKRVVTESSPHLFLTCSEDGEVRQWDLRQPSSAYPPPSWRTGSDSSVPPPLISYKRYDLDLNTISCSPSQPHYIALGGAHLHCFLHDRRMVGRDKLHERAASPATNLSDLDDDALGQATKCVRKFAPRGKSVMKRTDNGHITACKISDAHPNEMIVSWSGDHIYSFDLVRSPDASEQPAKLGATPSLNSFRRVRESSERKRKRKSGSQISAASESPSQDRSRQRTEDTADGDGDVALRVRYENGQSEDIPIEPRSRPASPVSSLRESVMSAPQKKSYRLARGSVDLRGSMFTLGNSTSCSKDDPVGYAVTFTQVREKAGMLLPQMADIIRSWRYPVDPSAEEVYLQRTLRSDRESAWRFVQASGVIARALGGRVPAASTENATAPSFTRIEHVPNEGVNLTKRECFGYDFIKAIFLWLDSGIGALIEGFTRSSDVAKYASRLPVPKDASADAFDECIVPYLLRCAANRPICNVDASRFEVDENRIIYATEADAVNAFVQAVKTPFADLSSSASTESTAEPTQSRADALMHWGLKVARGLLMNAGEGVNFAFVDRAFGGLGIGNSSAAREEASLNEQQRTIDVNEEDPVVQTMELTSTEASEDEQDVIALSDLRTSMRGMDEDEASILLDGDDSEEEEEVEDDEDEDGMDTGPETADVAENDEDEDEDEDEEEDGEGEYGFPRMMYRSAFERRRKRSEVEKDVYCSPHTRAYRGHCNVKTVKDVNFFGLEDEYVVSGSDDGNFFIWDRKTSKLLNILEGDGEVVNVLQGHPYEPMMAVSGIDNTIKIFSPDSRARESARLGHGIEAADVSTFSSISLASRMRGRRVPRQSNGGVTSEPAVGSGSGNQRDEDDDEYVARNGLASRKRWHLEYQITSQNDVERQGGNQEAFITRSMLATLAQQIRRHREGGDGDGEGVAGGRIAIGDDCVVQ